LIKEMAGETMSVLVKILPVEVLHDACAAYQKLYQKALPGVGGIEPERLEVATFNCSETMEEFEQVGLGLETVVIFRSEDGQGHTGKVLMNLPGQLLLEHGHVDTIVLKKGAVIAPGFVKLSGLINGFTGIKKYNSDASVAKDAAGNDIYLYRECDFQIVQAKNGMDEYSRSKADDLIEIFHGKSETFKAIYGDGVLFADTALVVYAPPGINPDVIPEELLPLVERVRAEQAITTKRMIYMTRGMNVLLSKNTRHAFLGGMNGCVYLEFSTPSMDEADRFTDKRVIR
jgi:D-lyxose ketol-isomerase